MSYISSAGFSPELTIVKVHIRHTNLVPEIEVKVALWYNILLSTTIFEPFSKKYYNMRAPGLPNLQDPLYLGGLWGHRW